MNVNMPVNLVSLHEIFKYCLSCRGRGGGGGGRREEVAIQPSVTIIFVLYIFISILNSSFQTGYKTKSDINHSSIQSARFQNSL